MGTLLTPDPTGGAEPVRVDDEAAVSLIREAIRDRAGEIGLDRTRTESLAAAASEIGHNQLRHAGGGEMLVRIIERTGVPGVEVVARDAGMGIADPTSALQGRSSSAADGGPGGGLGVGVSAAYRLADELDFDVRWGAGTTIAARKFARALPRSEVAVVARACQGETVIGDDAIFVRRGGGLLLAVADGLGHGPPAQEASGRAMDAVRVSLSTSPREILEICQGALATTRGAVVTVAFIPDGGTELIQAGVGNISSHLYRDRTGRRFAGVAGVVGHARSSTRLHDERMALGGRHVLLLHTDGVPTRVDLADDGPLLREPALIIAHRLIANHARGDDDVLVLVATG